MTHLALGVIPDTTTLLVIGIPLATAALALTGWALRRRGTGRKRSGSPAVKVAALAALGCTAYTADTSWRFATDFLDMAGTAERIGMFAAAEMGLFATALMARQNLATQGAPGVPGTLVWFITGVQIIPAYAESGPVGGTVRAFVGPVMAAMLWHLAMGIELRHRTPGAASHGLLATLGREARERLLSRLGIAARDRDAAQITRDRATTRAVNLAARLAEKSDKQQTSWRGKRLTRRLSRAIGRASVGTDPAQRAALLNQLAARRHALALATAPLPSPWSPPLVNGGLVPESQRGTVPLGVSVPAERSRTHTVLRGDRSPREAEGPLPGTAHPTGARPVPETGDHGAGTKASGAGTEQAEAGTTVPESGTAKALAHPLGTGLQGNKEPAQGADPDRGPASTYPGTDTTGDRGPTPTNPGTDTTGDRGPTPTNPGTDTTDHKVPLRRKPTTSTNRKSRRKPTSSTSGKSRRNSQPRRQPKPPPTPDLQDSVDALVKEVLPHVPALLERDGNEAVNRKQLREILRQEGLSGGRNEHLGLVLDALRTKETPTMTRSTR
ncbi:hypothetical protein ACIO3O_34835 [Streptomyces sp. NPDC087440]|uniref:hypothetical protein n=1 Tax=Streptomyces sp. NPDC087440 TaxID=3365790 RepID=UPI0037FFE0E4